MLEFNEYVSKIKEYESKINELNYKIEYRMLELFGPKPVANLETCSRRRDYGHTVDEFANAEKDEQINKLYFKRDMIKQRLEYLRRTGEDYKEEEV